jgi:ribonuclease J
MKNQIKITPLGGAGEVGGLNCTIYETPKSAILVDCGSMFPRTEGFGLDLIVPDFSYLKTIQKKLKAVILTHGHEDHIGGLPFLLKEINLPIYGAPFSLALVKKKLKEYPLKRVKTHQFIPGSEFKVGEFLIDTAEMSHSIIHTSALNIQTSFGNFAHVTDWKIDLNPPYFAKTDLKKLASWGKKGITALLSDSTNAIKPGKSNSEKSALNQIKKTIKKHPGRVLITTFSSNIERLQGFIDLAKQTNRMLSFVGRSMKSNLKIALDLGLINYDEERVIDVAETDNYSDKEILVVGTGTQGEPRAVLKKISMNQFKPFRIKEGDAVLFSSKIIPGNERNIFSMMNDLEKKGAKVIYNTNPAIHASGHAYQDEIKTLIQKLKPKYLLPIHGEFIHQKAHLDVGLQAGLKKENIVILEDGDSLIFKEEEISIEESEWGGENLIDEPAYLMRKVSLDVFRKRKKLAFSGIVHCVVVIDKADPKIISGPIIESTGFMDQDDYQYLFKEITEIIRHDLEEELKNDNQIDAELIQEEIRLQIRRFFNKKIQRKPVTQVFVVEI